MAYDRDNIFAKILRGEIPCDKVYEDEHAVVFKDIAPLAPVHLLAIPKGEYISFHDFSANASAEAIAGFYRAAYQAAEQLGLDEDGYRVLANTGAQAHQEVMHFHLHIFAGCDLGGMIRKDLRQKTD